MKHQDFLLGLLAALLTHSLNAQEVQIDPETITATASDQFDGDFGPENTLDGETLEGFRDAGDPGPPERPPQHQGNHWVTPNLAPDGSGNFNASITFDLGDTYELTRLEVLNTSNTNWADRETDTFTIETSSDGGISFSTPSDPVTLQPYGDGFQTVPFSAVDVTNVRLNVTNDPLLGEDTGQADVGVGLNEVRFFAKPPVDSDSDGLPDAWEIANFGDLSRGADDDDDIPAPDGLTNLEEYHAKTDPKDPDSDDDTLSDADEVNIHGSDPNLEDTDADQLGDADEVNLHNSDPTLVDTDEDGLPDFDEVTIHETRPDKADSDDDGLSDSLEINVFGTDPNEPNLRPDLIAPTGITVTAPTQYSAAFGPSNLVDDITLEGATNLGDPGPPERPAGHQNNHWITPDGILNETVTFDLGSSYDLTRIEVLNTSNSNWNDRETDTFTVATSADGGLSYSAPSDPVTLQDYTEGFQEVPLAANGVTHVQLAVTNDPLAGPDTGTPDVAVGLNEVRFYIGKVAPLQITSLSYLPGATTAELTWNSTPGSRYLVEFSDDLVLWDEAVDGERVAASNGDTTSFTVLYDPPAPVLKRYFRVTRLP